MLMIAVIINDVLSFGLGLVVLFTIFYLFAIVPCILVLDTPLKSGFQFKGFRRNLLMLLTILTYGVTIYIAGRYAMSSVTDQTPYQVIPFIIAVFSCFVWAFGVGSIARFIGVKEGL